MTGLLAKERIIAAPGYNRWRVPIASILIYLCIGSVYAWSIMNGPLTRLSTVTRPFARQIRPRSFSTLAEPFPSQRARSRGPRGGRLGAEPCGAVFCHWDRLPGPLGSDLWQVARACRAAHLGALCGGTLGRGTSGGRGWADVSLPPAAGLWVRCHGGHRAGARCTMRPFVGPAVTLTFCP